MQMQNSWPGMALHGNMTVQLQQPVPATFRLRFLEGPFTIYLALFCPVLDFLQVAIYILWMHHQSNDQTEDESGL